MTAETEKELRDWLNSVPSDINSEQFDRLLDIVRNAVTAQQQ